MGAPENNSYIMVIDLAVVLSNKPTGGFDKYGIQPV